jgi:hypothetical protein
MENFDSRSVGGSDNTGVNVAAKIQSPVFEQYKPEINASPYASNPAMEEPYQRRLSNVSNISGYRGAQHGRERSGSAISNNMNGFFADAGLNNSYINGQAEIGDNVSQRRGTLVLDGNLGDGKLDASFHS